MGVITASRLAEGAKYSNSTRNIALVEEYLITVAASVPDHAVFADAIATPGLPTRYSYHPTFAALICTNISCESMGSKGPKQIKFSATYEYEHDHTQSTPSRTGKCTLEFGTAMANAKVTTDAKFAPMILTFKDPEQGDVERFQACEFDVQIPSPIITFRRAEPLKGTDYIALKLAFEGYINSRPFNKMNKHTALCTLIQATIEADHFNVTYQFQFNRDTWDVTGVFKESNDTNKVAAGSPSLGVSYVNGGKKDFVVYPEADFTQLGLHI